MAGYYLLTMPAKPLIRIESGVWGFQLRASFLRHYCNVQGCGNPRPSIKLGPRAGHVCSSCLIRRWRANYREKAAFANVRDRARRTGIHFNITFPAFLEWGKKHGYFDNFGRAATELQVDRINNNKGYVLSNIQVLTARENNLKEKRRRQRLRQALRDKGGRIPPSLLEENDPVTEPENSDQPF
jgi:hypothetical protein